MDEIAADDIISKLNFIAERRIRDAIDAGEFDNLEGMGRPLHLEDNPFIPAEMRAAFTVLSNSGFAPDWVVLAQEIEADLARLRSDADRHFAYLKRKLAEVSSNPFAVKNLRSEVSRLKAQHKRASGQHSHAILELNRKIHTFNQTVPIQSLLKVPLSHADEMARYEDRVPGYLSY